jgi:hypothetical protein
MTTCTCTEAQFLADVAKHAMTVMRDDGVSRHLRFAQPGTRNRQFDLITWAGHLCYTGDMGTFVFARLQDMFEFFREHDKDSGKGQGLAINPGYWAEKLLAIDRSGYREYSADLFREKIAEWLDEVDATQELRDEVDDHVLAYADDGHDAAVRSATEFEHNGERPLQDLWEVELREYTFHFIWCCYALAWGIRQYDAALNK